jgi:hypothetical protein
MARHTPKHYEVVVDGMGNVFQGMDSHEARRAFMDWKSLSMRGMGRAAGRDVRLFKDGVVTIEHLAEVAA